MPRSASVRHPLFAPLLRRGQRHTLCGLFVAALVAASLSRCEADEQLTRSWPAFRGASGNGIATTTAPAEWSESGVSWEVAVPGQGWSSPAVRDSEIWLTTATEDGTELTGLCLELETGSVVWSETLFRVSRPREKHLFNSYASPTPAVGTAVAYLSWGSNGLAAVDRESKQTRWVRRDLPTNHYRGPGSSPILNDDETRLYLPYDGFDHQFIECFDAETGDTIWRTHRPHDFRTDNGDKKKAYGTPLLIDVSTDEGGIRSELVCPTSLGCFALDPETGRELWRIRYEQFSTAGRPVFAGGLLYLTTGFGKGEVHAVRPGGSGDVTASRVVWTEKRTMPSKPSPVVRDGRVYCVGDRGVLVVLDAATGERLSQTRLSGNVSASPLLMQRGASPSSEDRLLIVSEDGDALAVALTAPPTVDATSPLPDGVLASPVAIGERLLIRTRTGLVCLMNETAAAAD